MAILARDVTIKFNGGGNPEHGYDVRAKAGARLEAVEGGQGTSYAIPVLACEVDDNVRAIFKHDSTYYHIWAPKDAIAL